MKKVRGTLVLRCGGEGDRGSLADPPERPARPRNHRAAIGVPSHPGKGLTGDWRPRGGARKDCGCSPVPESFSGHPRNVERAGEQVDVAIAGQPSKLSPDMRAQRLDQRAFRNVAVRC
jgi:hypothetical protein